MVLQTTDQFCQAEAVPMMPANPRVSIIIPCYNGERYLEEALRSALEQTYAHVEVVAVDDGASDATPAILARHPLVRSLHQANAGCAAARNTGIRAATGDTFIFLDQDDRLLPDAAAVGVTMLQQHPEAGLVFGLHRGIDAAGDFVLDAGSQPQRSATYADHLRGDAFCPPSRAIIPRWTLDAVGLFEPDTAPADDLEMYLRVARQFPVVPHGRVVVEYRDHAENTSRRTTQLLAAVLDVMDRQMPFTKHDPALKAARRAGIRHWRRLFGPCLPYEIASSLKRRDLRRATAAATMLARQYPQGTLRYALEKLTAMASRLRATS